MIWDYGLGRVKKIEFATQPIYDQVFIGLDWVRPKHLKKTQPNIIGLGWS